MLDAIRDTRDFVGVMPSVVQRQRLSAERTWEDFGIGNDEVRTACESRTFTANEASDTGLLVSWARRAQARIQAKKNRDGLSLFQFATHDMGGLGTTLSLNTIAAARARLEGAQPNPATGDIFAVLHPYAAYPIDEDPIKGPYAKYQKQRTPAGIRDASFMRHYQGEFRRVQVFVDVNLGLDSNDDVKNGIFSKEAITLVEVMTPRIEIEADGAGGVRMWLYDDYAYQVHPPLNRLVAYTTDACAPS